MMGFWSWEVACAGVWGVHISVKSLFYKTEGVKVYFSWGWH